TIGWRQCFSRTCARTPQPSMRQRELNQAIRKFSRSSKNTLRAGTRRSRRYLRTLPAWLHFSARTWAGASSSSRNVCARSRACTKLRDYRTPLRTCFCDPLSGKFELSINKRKTTKMAAFKKGQEYRPPYAQGMDAESKAGIGLDRDSYYPGKVPNKYVLGPPSGSIKGEAGFPTGSIDCSYLDRQPSDQQ